MPADKHTILQYLATSVAKLSLRAVSLYKGCHGRLQQPDANKGPQHGGHMHNTTQLMNKMLTKSKRIHPSFTCLVFAVDMVVIGILHCADPGVQAAGQQHPRGGPSQVGDPLSILNV